ncbi:MAG: SDR family NAD(P)-dependent oxidoreductase [Sphingomonadales bacterium]
MGRLDGKVAIITGAASGMGACEAGMFAAEGARVVATDIDEAGVREVVRGIGANAIALRHDVTREDEWAGVVEAALDAFGRIDVLVNNAAIHYETRFADITLDEWRRVLAVDLDGTFLGTQAVVPHMIANGGGSIVNISSVAAMIGGSFAHYSAAKGGIRALTRATAVEYAQHNVRANSVYPGLIETPLTAGALANPEIREMLRAATALPRFGRVEDIGYCVLYLASDESAFATGAEFVIDGGVTAK